MRRFLSSRNPDGIPQQHFDVVVAGGGLAGLYAAILLPRKYKVAIVVKNRLQLSNSMLAQGGIAASVAANDSPLQHFYDSMSAGSGLSDADALRLMVESGPGEILRLATLGVPFETDSNGQWVVGCEGAHTRPRILRCGGDATGRIMMESLIGIVLNRTNITVLEDHYLTDIVTDRQQRAKGIITFHGKAFHLLTAPVVVLATGGLGGVYRITTNEPTLVGDGIAAALRAGVRLQNMEFVQFHPTAFYLPMSNGSHFLISETVRGEGAILRNARGVAFMENRHILKDLAPRDVVAREIYREMTNENSDHVFLDITHRPAQFLSKRFPNIYAHCSALGYKMESQLLPVSPAQHYFMGGIATDKNGRTSMPGLYACGETACTGVHGANRLAGNSLLECVVFAAQVAWDIQNTSFHSGSVDAGFPDKVQSRLTHAPELINQIRIIMQSHGGIVKQRESLVFALNFIATVCEKANNSILETPDDFQLMNMATVAREILLGALARPDDMGAHYFVEETDETVYSGW